MMEFLALNGHMRLDCARGAVSVTILKCGNDCFVFRHRLLQAAPKPQLNAPEWLEPAVQAGAFLFQKAVARLAIENGMKALVFAVIPIRVLCFDGGVAACIRVVQVFQRVIGNARGGKPGADGLKLGHHFEHFDKLDRSWLTDEDAAPWDLFDEPRLGKPLQCLPNGRPRYGKALGKLHFIQPLGIGESPVKDEAFQFIGNDIRSLAFHILYVAPDHLERKITHLVYKNIDFEHEQVS